MDRILGAFTFRKGVYSEVEQDAGFTSTAWLLVAIAGFLSQLGTIEADGLEQPGRWLLRSILGTVFVLISFAVGAAIVGWVGRAVFKAQVTFDELVRTLGLAYVWNGVGVLGVLGAVSTPLSCVVAPARLAAALLGLVAWFVAAKEALDLDWVQVVVTVVLAFIAGLAITFLAGLVLAALGLGTATVGGLFS